MKYTKAILILGIASVTLAILSNSCNRCYTCTGQTDFGEVEKEVCGRKADIEPLIQHLQSDTNPWECVKQ